MTFKTYCWSVGTTSFRTKNFIFKIERQLHLLKQFWELNPEEVWERNSKIQQSYYEFLKSNEFVSGDASNKAKDARQKTSGLVDIGLINSQRRVTEVGNKIEEISKNNDYSRNNILNIPSDCYIYLLQLLKLQVTIDDFNVRPFVNVLYLLEKNNYLSYEELTYLVPMCKNKNEIILLSNLLSTNRESINYDNFILDKLMVMDNYIEALEFFQNTIDVNETTFEEIGMNRDGGQHDRPYNSLYQSLIKLFDLKTSQKFLIKNQLLELYDSVQEISNTVSTKWKQYLFPGIRTKSSIDDSFVELFLANDFMILENISEIKTLFFQKMHLFKCKSNLEDYFDLNKRYFSLTEIVKFDSNKVILEMIPNYFFKNFIDNLLNKELISDSAIYTKYMEKVITIEEIIGTNEIDKNILLNTINNDLGTNLNFDELLSYVDDENACKFKNMIEEKFSKEYLLELLTYVEDRNDNKLYNEISNNADIPTIFEYILGISWYYISDKKGDLLKCLNMSLDNNFLPKTHAGGGMSDIEYKYINTPNYSQHTLLIEATLADSTSQRSMEMEPVSRHLGESIKRDNNFNNYAVFVAPKLDERLILDFRNMKSRKYPFDINSSVKGLEVMDNEGKTYINGLKIIPITVGIIKKCLSDNKNYNELYKIFKEAYDSNIADEKWYNENIIKNFI